MKFSTKPLKADSLAACATPCNPLVEKQISLPELYAVGGERERGEREERERARGARARERESLEAAETAAEHSEVMIAVQNGIVPPGPPQVHRGRPRRKRPPPRGWRGGASAPLRAGGVAFLPGCGQFLAASNSWDRNTFLRKSESPKPGTGARPPSPSLRQRWELLVAGPGE